MSFLPDELSVVTLMDGRTGTLVSGSPSGRGIVEVVGGEFVDITAWDIRELVWEPGDDLDEFLDSIE